jgi:site-specific recombinase XerD
MPNSSTAEPNEDTTSQNPPQAVSCLGAGGEQLNDRFQQFVQSGLYLRNWSPRTAKTYGQALASYQRFQQSLGPALCDEGAPLLSKARLEAWIVWLRQQGLTPGGTNVYIRTFNSFLSWLHEEGHIDRHIRLRLLPDPKKPVKIFTDEHVRTINNYKPERFYEYRLHTLFLTMFDTGVRIQEGLTLEPTKINFETRMLLVMGKGRKERWVPFSEQLRKRLFRFIHVVQKRGIKSQYVFCSGTGKVISYRNAYRDIEKLCTKLAIVGEFVHPHSTRHYFACSYIRQGGDIFRLSKILGHASVQTTMIYLRGLGLEVFENQRPELNPLSRLR